MRTDPTTTHLLRQRGGVVSSARSAAKWILLDVAETSVAKLLLHVFFGAEHWVADDHAEALQKKYQPSSTPIFCDLSYDRMNVGGYIPV